MHFFCGGIAAIFGNATGGRKGALIGPFIGGIILSFLPLVATGLYGGLSYTATYWSDSDFNTIGVSLGPLLLRVGKWPIIKLAELIIFAASHLLF